MARPIKICFISLNSWPLFQEKSTQYFGGAEVQIALIVKHLLLDKRFKISLVVGDFDQPDKVKKNNLDIYKSFANKNFSGTNTFKFLKLIKKINADIYVERTLNPKVGIVSLFCKIFHKKFVYMMAHDWDSSPNFGNYLTGIYKELFSFGLKQADLIIAQTKKQQLLLLKNFNLPSKVIFSVIKTKSKYSSLKRRHILWVGRADRWKRPEQFIRLAKAFPREQFIMVCRQGMDTAYFEKIKKLAMEQKNINFYPAVPIEEIVGFFAASKLFVNTSIAEGFPNTFLQSGLANTPIFSSKVNPDNFLNQFQCGLVGRNQLDHFLKQPRKLKKMGINNYNYVQKYHSLKNIKIFKQALFKLI